jgi:Tol biopolymer transport system component
MLVIRMSLAMCLNSSRIFCGKERPCLARPETVHGAVGESSISISPDGQTLAVEERLTSNIDTFHINPNGTLGSIVVNPSAGVGAFSGRFAPDGKLIVSETGSTISAMSSCTVLSNNKLIPAARPFPASVEWSSHWLL